MKFVEEVENLQKENPRIFNFCEEWNIFRSNRKRCNISA